LKRLSAVVPDDEYKRIERLVRAGAARSVAEFVRLAVSDYSSKTGAARLLNLREIPVSEARRLVERYLENHPGVVWPDEMAEELGIDYRIILAVVKELLKEDKVEEVQGKPQEVTA